MNWFLFDGPLLPNQNTDNGGLDEDREQKAQ